MHCPECGKIVKSTRKYNEPTAEHITFRCTSCKINWFYIETDTTVTLIRRLETDEFDST